MKVLLINPPYRESLPPSVFPSGIGYIASVLMEGGHEVSVLDINGCRYSRKEVEKQIRETNFDLVAIGGLITRYKYIKWVCTLLKKYHPDKFRIVGGAIATSASELVINKMDIDGIVLGEGEYTILELANALEKGSDLKKVDGIWFKKNGKVVKNQPRELIKDLDSLPFPAWDLFPIKKYLQVPCYGKIPVTYKSMNISTVRGCPFSCKFCYNVFGTKTSRARSIDNVISEINELREKYGVKAFLFEDDLFTLNRARVMEFCKKIMKKKLDIIWGASARVDVVDEEMLMTMKQAGCILISYGIETGSQKMLDSIGKGVKVEQAKKAIRLTKKTGMQIVTSFMVGVPGETPETIKAFFIILLPILTFILV